MYVDQGDVYALLFTLTDENGVLVDATTVTVTIVLPDLTTESHSVAPTTTGNYEYVYQTVQVGRHVASWVATGGHDGAYSEVFDVSGLSQGIISLTDAKAQLNIPATSTVSDSELRQYIDAVTSVISDRTGRQIGRVTLTERTLATWGEVVLQISPVTSVTSIVTDDGSVTWTPDQLDWSDDGLVCAVVTAPPLFGYVNVTYVAGYTAVPPNYILAALVLLQHLWQTKRGQGGPPLPGAIPDLTTAAFAVPYKVLELLGLPRDGVA